MNWIKLLHLTPQFFNLGLGVRDYYPVETMNIKLPSTEENPQEGARRGRQDSVWVGRSSI